MSVLDSLLDGVSHFIGVMKIEYYYVKNLHSLDWKSTGPKPNYKFLMTTQAPHPRCLYLDMMLRLSIPLSTLVPALIQLAAVSTTPVGGSIVRA